MSSDLFLPEADEEFREAARYYESEAPGLGIAFIAEVHGAVASILESGLTDGLRNSFSCSRPGRQSFLGIAEGG